MLRSFIQVRTDSDFPIQNLPYGVFRRIEDSEPHIGVAIGDYILDLRILEDEGMFFNSNLKDKKIFYEKSLNAFMSLGKENQSIARQMIQNLLREDNPELRDNKELNEKCFVKITDVEMLMPVEIGDYTDFYSSKEHATNVGIMFRGKENALLPNWLHLPVAYHGRASSVVISGTDIIHPLGQFKPADKDIPEFGKSKEMDFELEVGFLIGERSKLGEPISVNEANKYIFGMVLVNDWSARDIQRWEYVPLGPFLAKNFATSVSPWIVTLDALEPFKTEGPNQNPEPLSYLKTNGNPSYDIKLEVYIKTQKLSEPYLISKSNFKYLYWNIFQQLAHHTVNGCNIRTGDLMASGTISGVEKSSFGSMLELAWKGTEPIKLPNGEERIFLQDGDTIIIKGYCQGDGYRIGFGEVSGKIISQ
jgi:fumarylacetoacetase